MTLDLDNFVVPDLRPDAMRQLDEYIKAMNVMTTLRFQEQDDTSRFWYAQVVDHIDPVLLYVMLNVPGAHRLKAQLESLDNAQVVLVSPYQYDMLQEYEETFKEQVEGAQNIDLSVLIGGKDES